MTNEQHQADRPQDDLSIQDSAEQAAGSETEVEKAEALDAVEEQESSAGDEASLGEDATDEAIEEPQPDSNDPDVAQAEAPEEGPGDDQVADETGAAGEAAEDEAPEPEAPGDEEPEASDTEPDGDEKEADEAAGEGAEDEEIDDLFLDEDLPPEPTDAEIIKELEQKLVEKDSEIHALKSRLMRSAADYDNYRKRSAREKEDLEKYAAKRVVTEFLPIVDNLERAIAHSDKSDEGTTGLADGVRMVLRQFESQMAKFGVKAFDSMGEIFDPERHEAVQQVTNEEVPTHTIVEEFQRGYFIHDRLLRPAMVVVAKNPND